ncbi:hypothetical protein J6590_026600 [Homalodisca vitripennis]|nr:hypothetical protein J6590_026600 [Homalodisca vitripennis]
MNRNNAGLNYFVIYLQELRATVVATISRCSRRWVRYCRYLLIRLTRIIFMASYIELLPLCEYMTTCSATRDNRLIYQFMSTEKGLWIRDLGVVGASTVLPADQVTQYYLGVDNAQFTLNERRAKTWHGRGRDEAVMWRVQCTLAITDARQS